MNNNGKPIPRIRSLRMSIGLRETYLRAARFALLLVTGGNLLAFAPVGDAAVPSGERTALLSLYNATNGNNWTNKTGWLGAPGTECSWYGVQCDQDRITGLILTNNNLSGQIPGPVINQFTELKVLNLGDNKLTGQIPSLSSLHKLEDFSVPYNQLTGPFPSLSNVAPIRTISVGVNNLNGPLPPLGADIVSAFFSFNHFTGPIPDFSGLVNLKDYRAQSNQLTGPIPPFVPWGPLEIFMVDGNNLSGSIPWILGMTSLKVIDVSNNQLTGSLGGPGSFPNSLEKFIASNNSLNGPMPSLASTHMVWFRVDGNPLTGQVAAGPSPNTLEPAYSRLCPSALVQSADAQVNSQWNVATGVTPWYGSCAEQPVDMIVPLVGLAFDPPNVALGSASSMTITLTNSNSVAVTGVAFTDTYPAGIKNGPSNPVLQNTCGGALNAAVNGNVVQLTGGTIPAHGSCTIKITVFGVLAGVWPNSIGPVTSNNAPTYVYNLIATLTVVAMNHPPVPQDDQIEVIAFGSTNEIVGDPRIPASVLDNDTDPDQGDFPVFAQTVIAPACGTVTLQADGTFMYVSTSDQCLTDSFQYEACDTFQSCALATVHASISVPIPNHPPVPQNDQIEVAAFGSTNAIVGDPIIPSSVLDNDTDPDPSDHVASATIAVNPVCGNLTLNSNGTFTYQSTTDNCVTDSFKYNACDTHTLCAQATVHINISGADPDYSPVAIDDAIQVTPGGTTSVLVGGATSLIDNDFDPNPAQPLSLEPVGTFVLGAGTLTLNADGTFSYQNSNPNATSDFFQYAVCDDTPPFGLCGTGTVTITISSVPNHLPIAVDDASQVALGSTTSVLVGGASTVLANDSDPDGDALTAKLVGPSPPHGQLTFNSDGTFTYQHNGDSATSDSFTYQVSDTYGAASSATVTITIGGGTPNSLPVAADDAIQVAVGGAATTLIGGALSVLANDTDPDLGETATLTADLLSLPAHGQVTLNADGTFSYQHNGDVATSDSFSYEARDVHGAASAATVTITIGNGAVNLPPITVDDAIQVAPNGVATVLVDNSNSLLDNDFDPNPGDTATLTVQQVGTGPANGTLTLHPDGTFSYHAFNGPPTTDSFQYQACDIDPACSSPPATVWITISNGAADNLPIAVDDALQVSPSGTATTLVGGADSVLANDSDPDPGETATLMADLLSTPAHGTLTFNSDGTFNYQHNGDAATSDSFVYQAQDVRGASSAAVVTITIGNGPVNHLPFAVDDAIDIAPGDTSSELVGGAISVLGNDVDPDSGETAALTAKLVGTGPSHGTLVFNDDGTFSYQNSIGDPATIDEFHYEACDIHGACAEAVVTISIGDGLTNHLPVVVDDEIQVAPNGLATTLVGGAPSVLANDFDPDAGETVTLSAVDVSGLVKGSGTLALNPDGSFSYQNQNPALSPDSFFYEACDIHGACKGGIVIVTITNEPMNHVPIAIDDAIQVASGGTATILVGGSATVLSNDSDPDPGDDLTAQLIGTPDHGIVEILTVDGGFIYHNNAGDPAATDSFVYQACDFHGACAAATVSITISSDLPTVVCVVPTQVDVVGDVINLDLSLLFIAPAGQSLTYSATNLPPSLSIIGSLLSGTLQASDVPGSPYASTLTATTVPAGLSASEDVTFQVLPVGEIVFRNSFDAGNPAQLCQ